MFRRGSKYEDADVGCGLLDIVGFVASDRLARDGDERTTTKKTQSLHYRFWMFRFRNEAFDWTPATHILCVTDVLMAELSRRRDGRTMHSVEGQASNNRDVCHSTVTNDQRTLMTHNEILVAKEPEIDTLRHAIYSEYVLAAKNRDTIQELPSLSWRSPGPINQQSK